MSIFPTDQRILSGIDTDPQGVDNENPALLDSDEEPHSYLSSFDLMLKLCASVPGGSSRGEELRSRGQPEKPGSFSHLHGQSLGSTGQSDENPEDQGFSIRFSMSMLSSPQGKRDSDRSSMPQNLDIDWTNPLPSGLETAQLVLVELPSKLFLLIKPHWRRSTGLHGAP